jgi:hypothetical protein
MARLDPDLRTLLQKYGSLHCKMFPFPARGAGIQVLLRVSLVGGFTAGTLGGYLRTLFRVPPEQVQARAVRQGTRPKPRVALILHWRGPYAQRLLKAVGWEIGKPAFDAKARAYRRWLVYRKSSGASPSELA